MKQKRKVKSLLPKKNFVNGRFLTILLVILSLVLCIWSVSLLTHSVRAADNEPETYTLKISVLYAKSGKLIENIDDNPYIKTWFKSWDIYEEPGANINNYDCSPNYVYVIMSGSESEIEFNVYCTPETWHDRNDDWIADDDQWRTLEISYNYYSNNNVAHAEYVNDTMLPWDEYNVWSPSIQNFVADILSVSGVMGDVWKTVHVTYYPDNNENGIPDKDEMNKITINYGCETSRGTYDCNIPSMEGIYLSGSIITCNDFDNQVSQYIPSWYTWNYDCDHQQCSFYLTINGQTGACSINLSPEKDQNNDGIWDWEQELWEITEFDYTWLDNRVEVLYGMRFLDPSDFTKIVNSIYMSGSSLYISPNPVVVNGSNNTVDTGVYSHILWWADNEVYSNNITLIAWSNNKIHAWNDNASVLWWNGNEVMSWKSGWIPTILVGWESNVMGTGHDGNALIWWKGNNIEEGHSNVFILWWENNIILWKDDWFDTPSKNAIIWWKNVKLVGFDDVFVYSNIDGRFSPASHKAFYLNVGGGVWISTGWIEWLSVGGAVSIWRVNINNTLCDNSSLWVIWSYSGCLVWCTKASLNNGWKWELLDQWNECALKCRDNTKCLYNDDIEVVDVPESSAKCTEWVVDTGNAELCINDLDSYRGVFFETSLIDSDDSCPTTGQNICVYKCDDGFHLTWDRATWKIGCYSNCDLPWGWEIKHNETVVAYNTWNVVCSNDIYLFPFSTEIINKGTPALSPAGRTIGSKNINGVKYVNRATNGYSPETCGNYDHKKTLICNDWVLELMDNNGKPISNSSGLAQNYNLSSCNLYNYRCNTWETWYNLMQQDIENLKKDQPKNGGSWEVADRLTLQWERWQYEVCIDFDARSSNPTQNGEMCDKKGYHYKFKKCQEHYKQDSDGVCRKQCSLINNNGDADWYYHGVTVAGFKENLVACPGECTWVQLTCDDGSWKLDGETVTWYYNYCNNGEVQCDSSYNLTEQKSWWVYSSCTSYEQGTCKETTKYKLDGCADWYHLEWWICVENSRKEPCKHEWAPSNADYTEEYVTLNWGSGGWSSPALCSRECKAGYITGYDESNKPISCINPACWSDANTCVDSGAIVTEENNSGDGSGAIWTCKAANNNSNVNWCAKCDEGSYRTGENETLKCDANVNGVCWTKHYNCESWKKNERNEWLSWWVAYSWDCLGVGSGTTDDLWCVECSNWYLQDGKICKKIENGECDIEHYNCKKWFSVNTGENDTEYYWDCDGENWWELQEWCKECKEWFHMNDDRECVSCAMNYEFEIMNVSWCYVMFKVTYYDPLQNGNPRPLTWSDFNSKFLLRYSKDGVNYRNWSHVEQTSWNMNIVKLFNNAESWSIYLKLQSRSGSCFGFVRSREVLSQSCPYESSCPNGGKTFYDGTCFNREYNALYSSTGRKIANISSWGLASDGMAPSQYCDTLPSLSWCSIKDKDPQKIYSGNLHVVCPGNYGGNYWNLLKSSNVIWGTGNLERIGAMGGAVLYIPGYDNHRSRIVLKNIVGQYSSFYFYIDKNDSRYSCYAGYLYEMGSY